jgi:hypothetical protein
MTPVLGYSMLLAGPICSVVIMLALVHLWSRDPGRRVRAWRLLKLLLRR